MTALAIELTDPSTWPEDLRAEAARGRSLASDFFARRREIDLMSEPDILKPLVRPPNEHAAQFDSLAERVGQLLTPHRIVAYHCTRLTRGEIDDIRVAGLHVISPELIRAKLTHALADGHITRELHDQLHQSNGIRSRAAGPAGIHLCPCPPVKLHADGIRRFFASWGGEAMYVGCQDEGVMAALARVGRPCVIRCALPLSATQLSISRAAEHFLAQVVVPGSRPDFELYTGANIVAADILEVVDDSDPRFLVLTMPINTRIVPRPAGGLSFDQEQQRRRTGGQQKASAQRVRNVERDRRIWDAVNRKGLLPKQVAGNPKIRGKRRLSESQIRRISKAPRP